MKSSFLLHLSIFLSIYQQTLAQFGVPKTSRNTAETAIELDGSQEMRPPGEVSTEIVNALLTAQPMMEFQTAVDVTALIEAAQKDPETSLLVHRLKQGSGKDELAAVAADLDASQIVTGMTRALSEMQMLDYLFQDPQRALEKMQKGGMIADEHLAAYKKDPSLLEQDTRKSLYFSFVSLATAGGYL